MNLTNNSSQTVLLKQAAKIIRQGGVVAFPTETVYGLGANALDPLAVAKIYKLKGRPQVNPLIVHISQLNQLNLIVSNISILAKKLIKAFWPGPLTLVLPKRHVVPNQVTAGLATVAVRMPNHPVALKLINLAKTPIAAPSANRSGEPSPTHHDHVYKSLGNHLEMVIEAGSCPIGLESTIINMQSSTPTILRAGGLPREKIEAVIGKVKIINWLNNKSTLINPQNLSEESSVTKVKLALQPKKNIICPGTAFRHYAPQAPLILVPLQSKMINKMLRLAKHYMAQNKRIGVLTTDENIPFFNSKYDLISLGKSKDLTKISANLFASFYRFNKLGVQVIIAQSFKEKGLGLALMDRLRRASEE